MVANVPAFPLLPHTHSASHSGVDGEGAASHQEDGGRSEEEEERVFVSAGDCGAGLGVRDDAVHEKALVEMHERGGARHDGNVHQGAQACVEPDDEEHPADQMAQHDGPRTDGGQRDAHRHVQGGEALHADPPASRNSRAERNKRPMRREAGRFRMSDTASTSDSSTLPQ